MKERPGMLLENQTPRGKQNPLPAALKQRHPKTRFQISHLLRDARLRNSEPAGCAAKASRFGNCEKIAKVTNIQRLRHRRRNIVRRACEMQPGAWPRKRTRAPCTANAISATG